MSPKRGLPGQIEYMEEIIAIKKGMGKDASFEEGLVKEWKRYLPGGDKHYLWVNYSANGSHLKRPPTHRSLSKNQS